MATVILKKEGLQVEKEIEVCEVKAFKLPDYNEAVIQIKGKKGELAQFRLSKEEAKPIFN